MSRAPYLLTRAREGYRLGHGELIDAMIHDGLWDVYNEKHMGTCGDACASTFGINRQEQDDYAVRSFLRARAASESNAFDDEIVPIAVVSRGKTTTVSVDEGPGKFDEAKLRALRPAFGPAHDPTATITAGNASSISDGAATVLLASGDELRRYGREPLARIVGASTSSQDPVWFTTAPIHAIRKLLDRIGWTVADVDLFEVNEAFAVVAMVAARELAIPEEKLNVHGGAVALGHPIGCSGARILVTLLHALRRTGGRRGVASLCIGGGEAVALAVETTLA